MIKLITILILFVCCEAKGQKATTYGKRYYGEDSMPGVLTIAGSGAYGTSVLYFDQCGVLIKYDTSIIVYDSLNQHIYFRKGEHRMPPLKTTKNKTICQNK